MSDLNRYIYEVEIITKSCVGFALKKDMLGSLKNEFYKKFDEELQQYYIFPSCFIFEVGLPGNIDKNIEKIENVVMEDKTCKNHIEEIIVRVRDEHSRGKIEREQPIAVDVKKIKQQEIER